MPTIYSTYCESHELVFLKKTPSGDVEKRRITSPRCSNPSKENICMLYRQAHNYENLLLKQGQISGEDQKAKYAVCFVRPGGEGEHEIIWFNPKGMALQSEAFF